jgi:hypothetical protein
MAMLMARFGLTFDEALRYPVRRGMALLEATGKLMM